MSEKLNWLIQHTTPGSLVLQSWLSQHEVSPQLAHKYVKGGWLHKLRSGVYVRPGKIPQWHQAVDSLVQQAALPAYLAGLTSLTYQGKAHYLQLREQRVWLALPPNMVMPKWFKAFPEDVAAYAQQLNQPVPQLPQWVVLSSKKLKQPLASDLTEVEVYQTPLMASRAELAAFELLSAVPEKISFEHAAEVFQGLNQLNPKRVQSLLNRSSSIKTNRLYLFLAHYYNHPWVSRLNQHQISLGSGKRQVTSGGCLDHRFQITVPERYSVNEQH